MQQLALLPDELPAYGSPEYVHTLVEGTKLAMADREAWYGDAAPVPLGTLLSPAYNDARRALIGDTASYELRPGAPTAPPAAERARRRGGRGRRVRRPRAPAAGAGEPTVARDGSSRGDTCHLDVVDRWGNMISATPAAAGSSPTRSSPNWASRSAPGSRWPGSTRACPTPHPGPPPRTTLTPSLALYDGEPVMAFGTPAATSRTSGRCTSSSRWAARAGARRPGPPGRDRRPNWHTDAFPGSFYPRGMVPGGVTVESRVGEPVVAGLRRRGHAVTVGGPWSEGGCARWPATRRPACWGGGEPARDAGYAVGR
ncbi:gamma-glutamyltransferase [Streptomyces sp. M19]